MSFAKSVAYNTFVQILGKFLGTFFGLISVAMMARYLNTEGFGYYSTVITYLSLFGILIEFGLHITTLQLVSENKYEKNLLISNIFTLRLVSSLVAFLFAPILIWFFPYPIMVKLGVLVATASFLFITLNQILIGVLQLNLKMDRGSFGEVLGRLFLLLLIIFVIWFDLGFLYIMFCVSFGSFVNFIFNYYVAKKFIKFKLQFDFKIWKEIFTRSWPIGVSIFFNLVYLKADMLILSIVKTQTDVGIYGATYRFLDVLTTIPAMFMGLVLPVLRYSFINNDNIKFKRVFQKSFDFLCILVVPLIFGTFAEAERIILLIAGTNFTDAIPVLKLLIFALGAIFIGGGLYGYAIIALNKQKSMIFAYCITAILSLILYLIFIPKYSYFGAGAITIFSEYLISIFLIFAVYKTTKFLPSIKVLLKSIIAGIVMFICVKFLKEFNFFIVIILGGIIYVGVLFLIKGFDKKLVVEILKNKKV